MYTLMEARKKKGTVTVKRPSGNDREVAGSTKNEVSGPTAGCNNDVAINQFMISPADELIQFVHQVHHMYLYQELSQKG